MKMRLCLVVLLVCVAVGQVRGCCGEPDDYPPREERSARRRWRSRNGTKEGRRGVIRIKRGKLRIPLHRLREIQDMDLGQLLGSVRGASSHPAFVSFIADANVTARPSTTGTGLLGSSRPTVQGSRQSALHMDLQEVASERRSVIKDAGCRPRKVPVQVPPSEDPLLLYTPSCVLLPRCSGCCGHELLQCVPTEVKNIRKKVLALRFSEEDISLDDQESSIKRIKMEKHVKCGCQCKVKESNCSARQVYDAGNCRCLCPNEQEASSCPGTKIWSETDCTCKCSKVDECSTGLEFDPVQCRCLPSPSRPLLFAATSPAGSEHTASATPAVSNRPDSNRQASRSSQVVTGGTSSSGWGTAVSSGVIVDRPSSRSRPSQPSRTTHSGYQTTYRPTYQRRYQSRYPDPRDGDTSRYSDRRYDQTGAESQYSRQGYNQADAASRYAGSYDRTGANSRDYDRRYQQASYPSGNSDRRYG